MTKEAHNLFNPNNIDFTNEPLFLGSGRNVARNDLNIEQGIQKLTDNAQGLMWFKGDFPYKKDAKDFIKMTPELRNLYLKNFKFQTLLDSIAGRAVAEVFSPVTTNPQLELWWSTHQFFETSIHSPTYAEILKAMPTDIIEIFDDIIINDNILKRAKDIIDTFEDTIIHNARYNLRHIEPEKYNENEHKKSIVMSLFALNILEAVLFKTSFVTSFAYKENGIMINATDAIQKIQLD